MLAARSSVFLGGSRLTRRDIGHTIRGGEGGEPET